MRKDRSLSETVLSFFSGLDTKGSVAPRKNLLRGLLIEMSLCSIIPGVVSEFGK
ncbi:hypothetical protein GZ607_000536 [Salmonella enterica subsp. enterica serovar Pomona]|nr:hypothetical protein [Salmonella enterica subsp. enterica]EEH6936006.1 hypothetical protein [Salmonella enterica subsp. enterica serovar Pomona]EEJ1181032.1 hypothetical protein [Salmonella enterica subsp. enterica serovar Montevideo]EDX0948988.1 hypothetical protein [Salmonella enterica subsp. enterica]EDY0620421.1 hypothetical protein [Salmonella enterica subsp. enterica]